MRRRRAAASVAAAAVLATALVAAAKAPVGAVSVEALSACVRERLDVIAVVPEASFDPSPDIVTGPATGTAVRLRDGEWITFIRLADEEAAAATRQRLLADRSRGERVASAQRHGNLVIAHGDRPEPVALAAVADCRGG